MLWLREEGCLGMEVQAVPIKGGQGCEPYSGKGCGQGVTETNCKETICL